MACCEAMGARSHDKWASDTAMSTCVPADAAPVSATALPFGRALDGVNGVDPFGRQGLATTLERDYGRWLPR
jgi:hypothetical protein